jgi:hypothetical protein
MIGLQACQLSMLETKKNMRGEIMSKTLSLLFAFLSVALMLATAFSLSHNGWLALLFAVLTLLKARLRKKSSAS